MGAVYLAERADGAYQQRVALKILQKASSHPVSSNDSKRSGRLWRASRTPASPGCWMAA